MWAPCSGVVSVDPAVPVALGSAARLGCDVALDVVGVGGGGVLVDLGHVVDRGEQGFEQPARVVRFGAGGDTASGGDGQKLVGKGVTVPPAVLVWAEQPGDVPRPQTVQQEHLRVRQDLMGQARPRPPPSSLYSSFIERRISHSTMR